MIAKLKAQSFKSRLLGYSAKHIATVVGCSTATAYDWRSGRRQPPKWIQRQILRDLQPSITIANEPATTSTQPEEVHG
jgi:hypothetical protein